MEHFVGEISDIATGLVAIPKLLSLRTLRTVPVAETRTYLWSGKLDQSSNEE